MAVAVQMIMFMYIGSIVWNFFTPRKNALGFFQALQENEKNKYILDHYSAIALMNTNIEICILYANVFQKHWYNNTFSKKIV